MGFEWRRHNTGLGLMNTTTSYEEDHSQDTSNNNTTPSVSAFSRLLRHDQQGQAVTRRHSSVDESLYGSRPGSQLHPIKRPASIHSPVLAQFEEEPGKEHYNALIATPEFEIRDLDQYGYQSCNNNEVSLTHSRTDSHIPAVHHAPQHFPRQRTRWHQQYFHLCHHFLCSASHRPAAAPR